MEPRIQYAKTSDGVNIAYSSFGAGPALIYMPDPVWGVRQSLWQVPEARACYERLARGRMLVGYDSRGTGESDRRAKDYSLEGLLRDLDAVVDGMELESFGLVGEYFAGPVAIAYAARYPGRVSHLILWCALAAASTYRESSYSQAFSSLRSMAGQEWELYVKTMVNTGYSGAGDDLQQRLAELLGRSVSPSDLPVIFAGTWTHDATSLLSQVRAPTLVIHWRDCRIVPVEEARRIAASIPGAELVVLEGEDPWPDVGRTEAAARAIDEFLGEPEPIAQAQLDTHGEGAVTVGEQPDAAKTKAASTAARTFASGRYVASRLLGEGGQKRVYLVHDEVLGRDCALSLLRGAAFQDESLERFRREARAMAGIGTHANIVAVFDFGDEEGRPFLVCEYVPGGDLRSELVKAGGPLSLARALSVTSDIATGLGAAHQRGVIHRDLKPENVWLSDQGRAKLGDFGIASMTDQLTLTVEGAMMGTPAYMSPEQSVGGEIDARSDLYSLGAMLYEMTAGRPPFVGKDALAIVSQHVNAAPEPPSRHNSAISADLDALILRLLAKSPAARAASAPDVVAELIGITARTS